MKENEIKACLPLMSADERQYALQTGQISMYDLLLYESCKNEPYDYLFMVLPFEQALDWSIRIAKNKLDRFVNSKVAVYKFLYDIEDNGIINYNSSEMGYDDLVMATGLAIKASKWAPEAFDSDYAKCFDNDEYRRSQGGK